MKILIVDDIDLNRRLLRVQLEAEGFVISEAKDGVEALTILEQQRADAIISDILMPRMNGYQFCLNVRKDKRFSSVPFIFYTATYTSPADEQFARSLGADAFLTKPILIQDLLPIVRTLPKHKTPGPTKLHTQEQVLQEYTDRLVIKLEERNFQLEKEIVTRREVEASLKRLSAAVEQTADSIMITDVNGTIEFVNPSFESITGYSSAEAIGKKPSMLKSGRQDQRFYKNLWSTILDGKSFQSIIVNRKKNGEEYYEEHTITPIRDSEGKIAHFVSTGRDITDRVRAQAAIERSETELRAIFAAMTDVVLVLDKNGKYLQIAPTNPLILFRPPQDLIGRTIHEILPEEDAASIQKTISESLSSNRPIHTVYSLMINGKLVWFDGTVSPIGPEKIIWIARDITTRKVAEQQKEESERRYREMLQNIDLIAMTLDSKGLVTFANEYMLRLTGRTREEAIGKDWFASFLPEGGPGAKKVFEASLAMQTIPPHFENPIITKSGEIRDIHWNNTVLRDVSGSVIGTASIGEDVTERKRVEEALKQSEERFRKLFESSPIGIISINREGKFLEVNPAAERIFGYSAAELLTRRFMEITYPDDIMLGLDLLKEIVSGRRDTAQIEKRYVRKTGEVIWGKITISGVRDSAGTFLRTVTMIEDVTAHKHMEEQLRQIAKMESIGTLAGGVAHDFNNILGIIMAHSSLVDRGNIKKEDIGASMDAITNATVRGASLVRQLLTFARKSDIVLESVRLKDSIDEAVKLLKETLPRTISIEVRLAEHIPSIIADAGQIHQVLINLCVNARDAMPKGGKLTLAASTVGGEFVRQKFSNAQAFDYNMVEVSDTGFGMDAVTKNRIFEPFFTTKEIGKGTGLGLATVFGIMQTHNGFVEVESTPGSGTSFFLYFPVQIKPIDRLPTELKTSGNVLGGKETILVVEDEDMLLSTTRTLLEAKGYTVLVARDGAEAVQVYVENKDRIDLVLSDMGLPKIDGSVVFSSIRDLNPHVKFIMASGFIEPGIKSDLLSAGANDFLQKPYHPSVMLTMIRQVLDK